MKSRFQSLLVFVLLGAAIYGLGWLIGRPVSSRIHGGSRGRTIATTETETGTAGVLTVASDTNQTVSGESERELAVLVKHRAALQALEAKVLELDRSGQWRAAREALGDFEVLLMSLTSEDYPAVWKWFSQLQSQAIRAKVQRVLITVWSRVDPQAALRAVLTLPEPWRTADESATGERLVPYSPVALVLTRWGEKEPQAAAAWADRVPEELGRESAVLSVIEGMAKTDPKAAAELLEKRPPSPAREGQVLAVVAGLTTVDPEAAGAFLARQQWSPENDWQSSADRDAAVWQVGAALAAQDPQKALAWAQALARAKDRDSALTAALSQMAGAGQMEEAARLVQSLPDAREREQLTSGLASQLALQDTQSAAAWASQWSGDESLRKVVWDGLKEHWVRQDPAAVAQFALASFPAGEARTADFKGIAQTSLAHGFGHTYDDDAAFNLTQQLPTGPERDAVAAVLSERWAEYAPDQAASLVASMTPGAEQTRAAIRTAEQWADWDPVAAAAWAASFPAGVARSESLAGVAQTWAGKDAAAASDWLRTLPADDARARAAEAYVSKVADKHPELAAQWVAFMTNDQKRNQQIEKIGQQWLKKDPAAAQKWLGQSP